MWFIYCVYYLYILFCIVRTSNNRYSTLTRYFYSIPFHSILPLSLSLSLSLCDYVFSLSLSFYRTVPRTHQPMPQQMYQPMPQQTHRLMYQLVHQHQVLLAEFDGHRPVVDGDRWSVLWDSQTCLHKPDLSQVNHPFFLRYRPYLVPVGSRRNCFTVHNFLPTLQHQHPINFLTLLCNG